MNYSIDCELSSKNSFETVLAVRTHFYTIETIDKKKLLRFGGFPFLLGTRIKDIHRDKMMLFLILKPVCFLSEVKSMSLSFSFCKG